ncbi:MAG: VOC family protein [Ruminococcaceae bacterium]|nr:VOC family protein [Oscillospiraceae bacterium]
MKFMWTTIPVSDMEKSLRFYSRLMGLGPVAKMGVPAHQVVMLGKDGETKLELIYEPGRSLPDKPGGCVSMGFAPDNLDAFIAKLADMGIPAEGPISPSPDIRFFFVKDPDGYTVQLLEQK